VLKNALKNKLKNKKEISKESSEELSSDETLEEVKRKAKTNTRSTSPSPSPSSKSRRGSKSGSRRGSRNSDSSDSDSLSAGGGLREIEDSGLLPAIAPVPSNPISTTAQVMRRYVDNGRGHLRGCASVFDSGRGVIRADTYQFLLQRAENDFQKLIIIYALLAGEDGRELKKMVSAHLGCENVVAARKKCADLIVQEASSRIGCVDSAIYKAVRDKAENKAYVEERATLSLGERFNFMFSGQAAELKLKQKSCSRIPDENALKEKAYLKELRHKVITPLFRHVNNKQRSNSKAIQDTFKHLKRLAPSACP
jgi:hypothetical protein